MILITITNRHVPTPRNDLSFRPRHLVFAWPRLTHQVVSGDDEEGIGNDDSDGPTADPRMMVLRTFPSQGWSCEFSLEKGGTRIRPSGSRDASHEETQNAIWVSRARAALNHPSEFHSKPRFFSVGWAWVWEAVRWGQLLEL